jgi:hypothetical protein
VLHFLALPAPELKFAKAVGMTKQERHGQLPLELHFSDDRLGSASFAPSPGHDGGLFSCSIGPLSEEAVGELERAARAELPIRLRFSERPLLLDHVTVERKGPQMVRIVGHVVKGGTEEIA